MAALLSPPEHHMALSREVPERKAGGAATPYQWTAYHVGDAQQ